MSHASFRWAGNGNRHWVFISHLRPVPAHLCGLWAGAGWWESGPLHWSESILTDYINTHNNTNSGILKVFIKSKFLCAERKLWPVLCGSLVLRYSGVPGCSRDPDNSSSKMGEASLRTCTWLGCYLQEICRGISQ